MDPTFMISNEPTIVMVTRPETNIAHENRHVPGKYSTNPNVPPLKNKGLVLGLKGKTNGFHKPLRPIKQYRWWKKSLHQLIGI